MVSCDCHPTRPGAHYLAHSTDPAAACADAAPGPDARGHEQSATAICGRAFHQAPLWEFNTDVRQIRDSRALDQLRVKSHQGRTPGHDHCEPEIGTGHVRAQELCPLLLHEQHTGGDLGTLAEPQQSNPLPRRALLVILVHGLLYLPVNPLGGRSGVALGLLG